MSGLRRVAAQCGGLTAKSGGITVKYNAKGEAMSAATDLAQRIAKAP